MKKILFILLSVLLIAGCGKSKKATLKLNVDNLQEGKLVVSILDISKMNVVDTLTTNKKGEASVKLDLPDDSPNFFYVSYNGVQIASLILAPGDKVKVFVDTLGKNLKISGSEESVLLQQVNSEIEKGQKQFDSLTVQLLACDQIGDTESSKRIRYELGRLYVNQKQGAVKHLVNNPFSFTNIPNLYRQFNANFPLFAQLEDGVYYKQLSDSLKSKYPESAYVKVLDKEVAEFYNQMELSGRFSNVKESSFPDIELPDNKAQMQKLSQLEGRPFMLLFWDPADNAQKMLNAEIETIYNQYKGKGFEIYSVCISTDKAFWNSITNRFPWINVCDGTGANCVALKTYNVTSLPSLFLFDKKGTIVSKNVFETARLSKAVSSVCQE